MDVWAARAGESNERLSAVCNLVIERCEEREDCNLHSSLPSPTHGGAGLVFITWQGPCWPIGAQPRTLPCPAGGTPRGKFPHTSCTFLVHGARLQDCGHCTRYASLPGRRKERLLDAPGYAAAVHREDAAAPAAAITGMCTRIGDWAGIVPGSLPLFRGSAGL